MRNLLIAAAVVVAVVLGYHWYRTEANAQVERALATNTAAVLSVSFAKVRKLKVYEAKGTLLASTGDTNSLGLQSGQKTRAPFEVGYFVDLSKAADSYRWDSSTHTIFVMIPDVAVAEPRVDWTRAEVEQNGLWITRAANERLRQRAALQLANGARAEANKQANVEVARRSAVEAVGALASGPLTAAGYTNVRVVARFAADRRRDERWDMSRPIAEVLAR